MAFTVEQAFDFRGTEDAIMLSPRDASRILGQHHCELSEYREERADYGVEIDAGDVFAFLGY